MGVPCNNRGGVGGEGLVIIIIIRDSGGGVESNNISTITTCEYGNGVGRNS